MKKNQKKKVYVTTIDNTIAVCAKTVLSEEQFKKASANKERIAYLLDGTNVELWFIDESKKPYNLGIRSLVTGSTTSEAIAKEEEDVKNILDLLIERIDKFSEQSKEPEEVNNAPSDNNEEFFKGLSKEVEDSLKKHFGGEVKYAFFVHAGDNVIVDSTIHPVEIIHMLACATVHQK